MGTSTNAILAFGFNLGEDRQGLDRYLDEDFDLEDLLMEEAGHEIPWNEPYDPARQKVYEAWDETKEKVMQEVGVELITHCHHEYPMYFLAIKGTDVATFRGNPKEVNLPSITEEQIAKLKLFCERYDIKWREPAWHIMSYWG